MMETKKTTYSVEYWSCYDKTHRHKHEWNAKNCISIFENKQPFHNKVTKVKNMTAAVNMAKEGIATKEIAASLGLCEQTVISYFRRFMYDRTEQFDDLPSSVRAREENKIWTEVLKRPRAYHREKEISAAEKYESAPKPPQDKDRINGDPGPDGMIWFNGCWLYRHELENAGLI